MSSEEKIEPIAAERSEKGEKSKRRGSIGKMFGRSEKTSNSVDSDCPRSSPKPSRRASREDFSERSESQSTTSTTTTTTAAGSDHKKMSKSDLGAMISANRSDMEKRINRTDAHLYEQDQKINQMSLQTTALIKSTALTSQLLIDMHTWQREQRDQRGQHDDPYAEQGFASPDVQLRAEKVDGNCPTCMDVLFFWRDT